MFPAAFILPALGVLALLAFGAFRHYQGQSPKKLAPPPSKALPTGQTADRDALVREVLDAHRELLELNQLRLYSKLFQEMALPLQQLMGLAALGDRPSQAWASPERLQEAVREDIAGEIRGALRRCGAQQKNGKTIFPSQPKVEVPADFIGRVQNADAKQLRQSLAQDRAAQKDAQAWTVQKQITEGLNWLMEELDTLSGSPQYDPARTVQAAQRAQKTLEQCGVFPMFVQDRRLAEYPQLRERFVQVSGEQLCYPGLFFQVNGHWERFGTHSGTCREGDQR